MRDSPSSVSGRPRDYIEAIVERTRADKKRVAGKTRLILGRVIGTVEIVDRLGEEVLREGVQYLRESYP